MRKKLLIDLERECIAILDYIVAKYGEDEELLGNYLSEHFPIYTPVIMKMHRGEDYTNALSKLLSKINKGD